MPTSLESPRTATASKNALRSCRQTLVSGSTTVLKDWWIPDTRHTHLCILSCLTITSKTLSKLIELTHVLLHVLLGMDAYQGIAESGIGPMINLTHPEGWIVSGRTGIRIRSFQGVAEQGSGERNR